jgi:hypothetical protein
MLIFILSCLIIWQIAPVCGALYDMPNSATAKDIPFKLSSELLAMQKLKFKYGGNEFDMQNTEVNNIKIHQNYGCINFGTGELELLINAELPYDPITSDPPIICPFFTRIKALPAGLTPVTYSALAQPQQLAVGKEIAREIAIASFMGQSPLLDRVFIFKWDNANTEDDKPNSFQVTLVIANGQKDTYVIFKYSTLASENKKIRAGLNLGKGEGFFGIPHSSDGKLNTEAQIIKWVDQTYIFKVDEQIPQQLFCRDNETLNSTKLTLSAASGSAFASQLLMVRGPCFKLDDTVLLRWIPQSVGAERLDITSSALTRETASFRQPVLPEAAPGRYIVWLVINGQERISASFLLSTSIAHFVACVTVVCCVLCITLLFKQHYSSTKAEWQ